MLDIEFASCKKREVMGFVYGQSVAGKLIVCVCPCLSEHVIDHCVCVAKTPGARVLVCRLLQYVCRAFRLIGYTIFIAP